MPPGLVYQTGSSGPKNITVSVISSVQDPVRANGSSTTPGKRGTTEGILNDEDIALVAHELGHQLGLPDLYNDEDGGREYTELWDPMGFQTLQEFSAFSRYLPGWIGEYRTRIVERGTPPEGIEVNLVPRRGPSPREAAETVLIPTTGPILPQPRGFAYKQTFDGYILEARSHDKLDAARTAQREDGVTGSAGRWCDTNGLPEIYKDGVLITATRGAPATLLPLNPLTVKRSGPLGRSGSCDKAGKLDDAELRDAPYQVGQTFSDPDAGLRVKVLEKSPNGVYKVRIHFTPPPAPNLVASDAWLDSTANGYDTFWTPDNDGDGAPDLFGDPVYTPASVTLRLTAPPQVSFSTTTHRLSLRVQNSGNAAARGVTGTAYILGGEIPIGSELNGETLSRLAVGRVDGIRFGDIAAGATATRTVDITPVGPFVVALVVVRLQSEDVGTDNTRIEPFLAVQTGSGSPYKPVDVSLRVSNLDRRGNVVYASAGQLPAGWKGSLDATSEPGRVHAVLKGGGKETFRLQLQPPDPAVAKPGQVKEIPLTGYMSHGDSYVPVVKVPVAVVLSYGTALTLSARVSAGATQLGGRLTYRDGNRTKGIAGAKVRVAISAAGGKEQPRRDLTATTRTDGTYTASLKTVQGARYGAVAEYPGTLRYQALRSAPVGFPTAPTRAGGTTPGTTTGATPTPTPAPATPKAYGVADDHSKFADDGGRSTYPTLKSANMSQVRWTLLWKGASTPDRDPFLDRAVPAAGGAGIGIILALFPEPGSPPLPRATGFAEQFCAWAGRVARNYPQIRRYIIGNEVNAARFWPQTDGGTAVYYATLKGCYDQLKAVSPAIQVIGMGLSPRAVSRPASSAPIDFIKAMGTFYRADGRTAPIMDALAIHPYPNPNAKPPPSPLKGRYEDPGFFGASQLDRVKAAVETAFAGTAQPTTAAGLKLVIDEYGYQSDTSGDSRYTGSEGSPTVSEADQAAYYAEAITRILACDATVSDVLLFLLVDERDRGVTEEGGGWQSGLLHPDGERKPAFDAVATAIKTGCAS